ncbi:PREDICTED: laccase-like [Nicrophorus vespilloides]|uniref:Laccase-like n=1 Tax=Nicrophorus vespilloides TaxID=110193 RepID=A0ABM1M801_NICVS|nr:PREDICTED: laccase-like [Nicrophorus vespilloides]
MKHLLGYLLLFVSFFSCFDFLVRPDYRNHVCKRQCNGQVMTCSYEFHFEWIYTMEPNCFNCTVNPNGNYNDCWRPECVPADGANHLVSILNRMMPGPQIEVCMGDTVLVTLFNDMPDVATTIHWHGMHQREMPWMDGVPFVSQCPIQPNNIFRYRFKANPSGTHWYHSHIGNQRVNGAYGPLIVRRPDFDNPHRQLYDFDSSDHVISLMEMYRVSPDELFYEDYRLKQINNNMVSTILVNRFGYNESNSVPPARFHVRKGFRYRFRVIHGGYRVCPIRVKIDNHNMTIISSDGEDIQPVTVQTFYINNGERYDFVVTANQNGDRFWMRFLGLMDCENKEGRAILTYDTVQNAPEPQTLSLPTTQPAPDGLVMNCINTPSGVPGCLDMTQLRSIVQSPRLCGRPDFRYYFSFDTYNYALPEFEGPGQENVITTPVVNNISFIFPHTPLVQEYQPNNFCNIENQQNCQGLPICQCTHVVSIPHGSLVELVLVDEGTVFDLSHPIHLHGYQFAVVGQDRLGTSTSTWDIRRLVENNLVQTNCDRPILKDTVSIPDGGYVIIRFIADNPGYWLSHCHVEHHMEVGMGFVLQTGNPKFPPQDFPRCGDYYG